MSDYLKFDETGTIVTGYKGYPKNVSIPFGVKEIGNGAFSGCHSLNSVDIPDSVEIIGSGAFLAVTP